MNGPVTHPDRPGLCGYPMPAGTAGWVSQDDGDEWLTTDPPHPGMVVVEWVTETGQPYDYLWENPDELIERQTLS